MAQSPLHNIPLEWIRAFEAAGRRGSFTAAAAETGLTQAAISQRIGNLEEKLGTRLFLRQARGVVLTVDGETWLPYVSAALNTLQTSAQDLFSIQRKHFTISASTSIIDLWITRRLERLKVDESLQFSFKTMVLGSDTTQHDDEIKIRYGTGDWSSRFKLPLYKEAISPVASPKLRLSSDNWQALPRIALSGPRPGWKQWVHFSGDSPTPIPTLRFDTFSSALAAAKAGHGVLLASLPLCARELDEGKLIRLTDKQINSQSTYWLLAQSVSVSSKQWQSLTRLLIDKPDPEN